MTDTRLDVELGTGEAIAHPRAVARSGEHLDARDDPRTVGGRRPRQRRPRTARRPRAGRPTRPARPRSPSRRTAGVSLTASEALTRRVRGSTDADVPAARRSASPACRPIRPWRSADLRQLGKKRDDDRDRPREVRRGGREHDAPLPRALMRDPDSALREIAQPAVNKLGTPARRAEREVVLLDQRDGQPARDGVERGTGAGHAAADDENVDDLAVSERGKLARRAAPRSAKPLPNLSSPCDTVTTSVTRATSICLSARTTLPRRRRTARSGGRPAARAARRPHPRATR